MYTPPTDCSFLGSRGAHYDLLPFTRKYTGKISEIKIEEDKVVLAMLNVLHNGLAWGFSRSTVRYCAVTKWTKHVRCVTY